MEPITAKNLTNKQSLASFSDAFEMWKFANNYVAQNRAEELKQFWEGVENAGRQLTEHFFMKEHMWCTYVAGFTASTIAKKFPKLLLAHKIEDADGNYIPITQETLVDPLSPDILGVFGNRRKAASVQAMRKIIFEQGWTPFYYKKLVGRLPSDLAGLPGIGPTLACHLARNLGNKNVVKPDVHLVRLAKKYGFEDAEDMCRSISTEPVGHTDLVLWMSAADNGTL